MPHSLYVALARHEVVVPALTGQTLRLADWYVRLKSGDPLVQVWPSAVAAPRTAAFQSEAAYQHANCSTTAIDGSSHWHTETN